RGERTAAGRSRIGNMEPCAACGAPVPEAACSCPTCAAPIAPGLGQDERKLATIVFPDLVGSTELGGSLDPEERRPCSSSSTTRSPPRSSIAAGLRSRQGEVHVVLDRLEIASPSPADARERPDDDVAGVDHAGAIL